MRQHPRRSATHVKRGRVLPKHNWKPDRHDFHVLRQREIRLERRDPGARYRHLLTVAQVRTFLELLPDWEEIAVGLDAIVLDTRTDPAVLGWHTEGVVSICAWERELWSVGDPAFVLSAIGLIELLGVDLRQLPGHRYQLRWTEQQARAFQLLDVLPHELGHHRDRMTSRGERRAGRGERYAEAYARRVQEVVWPSYAALFEA